MALEIMKLSVAIIVLSTLGSVVLCWHFGLWQCFVGLWIRVFATLAIASMIGVLLLIISEKVAP